MILIISSVHDYHSRVVQRHLETRGHRVFIADILELGHGAEISYWPEDPGKTEWRRADGQCIRLGDVQAVWLRRSFPPRVPRQVTEAAERYFIRREWGELLRGVLVTLEAPFVNDPIATLYATKPLQLALAQRAGLNVRSCIAILRIIQTTPKPGKMPHLNSCWKGQHHGLASCFLSARPVRTHLALHHLAPHLAQAPGGGSSHAN